MSHEFQEPPLGGSAGEGCPDAERLASYLDGRLGPIERAEIEVHIEQCESCAEVVSAVVVYQATEASARPREEATDEDVFRPRSLVSPDVRSVERGSPPAGHWWRRWVPASTAAAFPEVPSGERSSAIRWAPAMAVALAALLVAIVIGVPPFAPRTPSGEPVQVALRQLEASISEFRPVEARMTGFSYHPLEPVFRSAPNSVDAPFAVREAAIEVEKAAVAAGPKDVEAQRALGKMYLVLKQPDRAVEALTPFIAGSTDAPLLTDFSAALLARRGPNDASLALDAAERAVRANPQSAEAWFNVGLAAEALNLPERAREAWTKYLELDASSGWAGEARKHLEELNPR